jgi:hypothetical protein
LLFGRIRKGWTDPFTGTELLIKGFEINACQEKSLFFEVVLKE